MNNLFTLSHIPHTRVKRTDLGDVIKLTNALLKLRWLGRGLGYFRVVG